jgi:hypothetical protein
MKKTLTILTAISVLFVLVSVCWAKNAQIWTTSGRGVILPNELDTDVELQLPICDDGRPLVQGVQVGPEIQVGNTLVDVVSLEYWGVSVPLYQWSDGGAIRVSLNTIAYGPKHVTATLPVGQAALSTNLSVSILVLGAFPPAAHPRFEFNVHVWGICGEPFIPTTP